jgi:hypothetical protein
MEEQETFDADYVAKLRNESAKYRSRVRDLESTLGEKKDLESQIAQVRVENELVRRGITADPSWVKVEDGDIASAVNRFVEQYPQFQVTDSQEEEPSPRRLEMPVSLPPEPNKANTPGPPPKGYGGRSVEEIKNDPTARQRLTETYRGMLTGLSDT